MTEIRNRKGRLTEEGEAMFEALTAMTKAFRPFTLRPMGGPGSQARLEQEEQNRAHARALEVLAKVAT